MDPTSSNKGKGLMNAISSNAPDKRFSVSDGKSLNLAPPPIAIPYNPYYMVPLNSSIYGEPLNVRPLTEAMPGEPVVPTPPCIRNHEAYKGGWKVLQTCRPDGRKDKRYKHTDFGTFRSMSGVLAHLDKLVKNKKNSSDQDKQGSGEGNSDAGPSQSAQGKDVAAYNEVSEAKSGAAYNKAAEANSAAGASYSAKQKSAA